VRQEFKFGYCIIDFISVALTGCSSISALPRFAMCSWCPHCQKIRGSPFFAPLILSTSVYWISPRQCPCSIAQSHTSCCISASTSSEQIEMLVAFPPLWLLGPPSHQLSTPEVKSLYVVHDKQPHTCSFFPFLDF